MVIASDEQDPFFTPSQLAQILTLDEFETIAQKFLSVMAYDYLRGGVGDEVTVAENRAAFDRIQLNPRVLVDVTHLDTSVTLFGRRHAMPILLAPTGYHKLFHPEGEVETVRGADLSECQLMAAAFSTVPFSDMATASKTPLSFQLYFQYQREHTRHLVDRVLEVGCESICFTVDVPVNGPRDRELRAKFALPSGTQRANLSFLGTSFASAAHRPTGRNIYAPTRAANATWKDLEWLRSIVPVPLIIKGVLDPDDAQRAVECGCDALIVSNHGGRSVDTAPSALDALRRIVDRLDSRVPLLVDGGIRRGTDVFKALALGAKAVLIGRSYLYGLAVGGAAGIARVVEILRTELEMTMGLMGCQNLSQIQKDRLWC
ncbi:MAG: alpha-hydroxy-acid oxidizing protein [Acidobacteriaceae bacterium]|nr:alpha-hydroxy-acid oxidizing protein [Acidobacteriaceae bacterium]